MPTDRLSGLTATIAVKQACLVASTTNLTLSSTQTIDGVVCSTGTRVLAKDQTDTSENGIYVVNSGPWERSKDFNGRRDAMRGTLVLVMSGTSLTAPSFYQVTSTGDNTPGTTTITFTRWST